MKKIKATICALIMCLSIPVIAKAAVDVNSGALKYNGGQNSSVVYSEIWDNKTSYRGTLEDNVNYGVLAIVKVGSNKYTSQWRVGYAYKDASRSFWSNETSGYDYEQITSQYTSDTWGETY